MDGKTEEVEVVAPTDDEVKELTEAAKSGLYVEPIEFLKAIKADGATPEALKQKIKAMLRLYDIEERAFESGVMVDEADEREVEKE